MRKLWLVILIVMLIWMIAGCGAQVRTITRTKIVTKDVIVPKIEYKTRVVTRTVTDQAEVSYLTTCIDDIYWTIQDWYQVSGIVPSGNWITECPAVPASTEAQAPVAP
jgi:hypothetical protein